MKSSARPKAPDSVKSKSVSVSHKSKSVQDRKGGEEADLEQGEETGEGEELEEDETEADTIEEEQEEPLHDGYAFRQGVYTMLSMLGKNSSRQHFEIFFFFFLFFPQENKKIDFHGRQFCTQLKHKSVIHDMMVKNFSRRHFEIIFLGFLENRFSHVMQIVSLGDNLHEMSKPIFLGK